MPRRRRLKISTYEWSLRNFTFGTAVIWVFYAIIFLILSVAPILHIFGLIASIVTLLSTASLFIAIRTRQQYYIIPFLTLIILFVAYILVNIVLVLAYASGRKFQSHVLDVILDNITNIELLNQYIITSTALGMVVITFLVYYILRGIALYYLALKSLDDEVESDLQVSFSNERTTHFI